MLILSNNNQIADTDLITSGEHHYSVLSFRDYKNPDFYFEKLTGLYWMESASVALRIGPYTIMMPLPWSILVTDYDTLECVSLAEAYGKPLNVFCCNPIDGYFVSFHEIKWGMIYPKTTWTTPELGERDMLAVPLGYDKRDNHQEAKQDRGPVCAIFSPTKMEINKAISDIW